jgi:UDP-N-acetylmuramoyl-tripeptide--D-alanyl-D-alanine ligase
VKIVVAVMRDLTLSQAAVVYGGTLLYPDCRFNSVSTDSRTLIDGDLFVALRGKSFDGHVFLEQVGNRASGFVVERPEKRLAVPQWVVPDTTLALGQLAALTRKQFKGQLIAVTGSSGKTTVKEMIAGILHSVGPVLATEGNLNNQIGVPKTLLKLRSEHLFAVIEMGASAAGDIGYLASLARPDISLITNVMPAHVEGFGSLAGVAAAKAEIYQALDAAGIAVLNLDEPWSKQWQELLSGRQILTFSVDKGKADIWASEISLTGGGCAAFILHTPAGQRPVQLPVPGLHNVSNALAAAACATAVGMDVERIACGLEALPAVAGRLEFKPGLRQCQVIDDSYNANPGSVKAAIDLLAELPGRKIMVLGDMAELGSHGKQLHREVGEYAQFKSIDLLLATGELCAYAIAGFGRGAHHFVDKTSLSNYLTEQLGPDVIVLIKGSRRSRMDELVREITSEGST